MKSPDSEFDLPISETPSTEAWNFVSAKRSLKPG
jgi:hypothetical protein